MADRINEMDRGFFNEVSAGIDKIAPLSLKKWELDIAADAANKKFLMEYMKLGDDTRKVRLQGLHEATKSALDNGDLQALQYLDGLYKKETGGWSPLATDANGKIVIAPRLPKNENEIIPYEIYRTGAGGAPAATPASLEPNQEPGAALQATAGGAEPTPASNPIVSPTGNPRLDAYLKMKAARDADKNQTKEQLVRAALREKHGKEPTASQVLDEMNRQEIEVAKQKGQNTFNIGQQGTEAFKDWDPATKESWFQQTFVNKERPQFGFRDNASRSQYNKEYGDWLSKNGFTGGSVAEVRGTAKALQSSLQTQEKNRGMMGSFVTNINGQVDKVEKLMTDVINRVGVRGVDLPIRELNTRFAGSGHEQVLAAYMKEISAEIAKLSQGSAASIQQLPEKNREEWEKIHDVNLSFRELKKVLEGTRDMANIRLKSVDDELVKTKKKLRIVGSKLEAEGEPIPSETQPTPRGIKVPKDKVKFK